MNARFALGALALAVAACGSSTSSSSHAPATSTPAASPTAASPSMGPGDVPVMKTARRGQPFHLSYSFSDGGSAAWKVTLNTIDCGGPEIFNRKLLNEYYSSMGEPLDMPKPATGTQFCFAKFTVVNEGNKNQPWSASETTLNVGMRAYDPVESDSSAWQAAQAYDHAAPSDSASGLNPGRSGVSHEVFEIPAGSHPTSMSVPNDTSLQRIDTQAHQVLIELP
jgi:hypothetical protein